MDLWLQAPSVSPQRQNAVVLGESILQQSFELETSEIVQTAYLASRSDDNGAVRLNLQFSGGVYFLLA